MPHTILEAKDGVSFSAISALAESVGWGSDWYQTEEKWNHLLAVSTYIAYIKDSGRLIGFGRILEDGYMCMFYDVMIHKDYQGQGIGTQLMNHLIDKIKDKKYVSIGLIVEDDNPSAVEFYRKLGFENVISMELKKYMMED